VSSRVVLIVKASMECPDTVRNLNMKFVPNLSIVVLLVGDEQASPRRSAENLIARLGCSSRHGHVASCMGLQN
jgi:hypothetical protein